MKKLLFFALLLVGLSASAQVEVSHNGFTIDSVGVTTVVKVTITARRVPTYIDAIIYTDSANVSTVRFNDQGTEMFNAEPVPANKFRPLRIVNGVFWIKLEDADDVISIWW
jgi:hypothetical protein